jgi:hypothetical protein
MVAEAFGKFAGVLALAALIAAHVQRFAHQEQPDVPFVRDLPEMLEILSNTISLESLNSLRCEAQLIANGKPDAFLADVESENARRRRNFVGFGVHLNTRIE